MAVQPKTASTSIEVKFFNGFSDIAIPRPAGLAVGDLMIAHVGQHSSAGVNITPPAGWTLISPALINHTMAWRVATASEPASYKFLLGGDNDAVGIITVYTGQHAVPIDTTARTLSTTASPVTAPAATANFPGGLVVRAITCRNARQTFGPVAPAGVTKRGDPALQDKLILAWGDSAQGPNLVVPVSEWTCAGTGTDTRTNYGQTVVIRSANVAPNAPTLKSPVGNVRIDRATTQRFTWTPNDPNPGDSQSKYDLWDRLVNGVYAKVTGVVPNAFHDFAPGSLALGDHEWILRSYDSQGEPSPFSASGFYTAADMPPGPTITSPINNGTVSASPSTVRWSYPNQTEYQVRTVGDLDGVADPTVIYFDSGIVASAETRARSVPFPVTGRTEHVQVRVRDGLLSPWTSVKVLVSYTPPATPSLALTTNNASAAILLEITNPTPATGQPAVTAHDLYRRENGVGEGIRLAANLAPGATYVDRTPGHGVDYGYRAVSVGDNGTTSTSPWTGDATPAITYSFGGAFA